MKTQFMTGILMSFFLIGAAPGPQVHVHVQYGFLSVKASGVPLKEVLKAIGDQSHLVVTLEGNPKLGDIPVSMDFDLPFHDGLSRLVNGWDYAMFKDPQTGQRVLLVFTGPSNLTGSQQETTTLAQALTRDDRPLIEEPTIPEHYSEVPDVLPPQYYPQEKPNSSPPADDPFQDQDALEGLRTGLQSQDPMERQMALMELGPRVMDAPELLTEIEYLATQDSDPLVQEMATEMLKHFSSNPADQQPEAPSDGDVFQDQNVFEGLRARLQSQDPTEREMALMELGPRAMDAPELLSEIESLSTQDSDPGVQEMATEMLKHFSP